MKGTLSPTRLHEDSIREMCAEGFSDPDIGYALGVSAGSILRARRRLGIPPRPQGGAPYQRPHELPRYETPIATESRLSTVDELFAMCIGDRRFVDAAVPREPPLWWRPDPAAGLGASSAFTAMEMGENYRRTA